MIRNQRLEKLEAVRGLAAFYVMVHHFVHSRNELAALQKFFVFGQFAVLLFFVLSGFVIFYSLMVKDPNMGFGKFFLGRFRRIFPVYILAMLTNYGLRCWGLGEWADFPVSEFLLNVAQLQDDNHPYAIVRPFLMNHPLWSLSYEWWFYMLFFPLQAFLRQKADLQKWIVGAFSAANVLLFTFFSNGMSMFFAYWIIWWAGVEMAREYLNDGRITLSRQISTWGMVAAVGMLWFLPTQIGAEAHAKMDIGQYPYLQIRHFVTVLLILGCAYLWYKLRFVAFDYIIGPFKYLAPISYALYIVHLPFIQASIPLGTGNIYLDLLIFMPIILAYAWVMEQPFQRWVNRWMK